MQLRATAFLLFLSLSYSQEPLRPVGIKITRPGVVSIAGSPPVGGTLVSYGYSLDQPATGSQLQGMSTLFEQTLATRVSIYIVTTEPLVRNGHFAWGDTCPGIKFRLAKETSRRPLLAISYGLKVPTASEGFGTGRYDHKINTHADKGIGRTRFTGNFATVWSEQKDGRHIRQYTPALGALTRWHGRWGTALQTYWTTAGKGYGGVLAAPFVQINPNFNLFAGTMRNLGRYSTRYSLVAGFNYMHRK
jgi:hypothetical protein